MKLIFILLRIAGSNPGPGKTSFLYMYDSNSMCMLHKGINVYRADNNNIMLTEYHSTFSFNTN